MFSRLFLGTCLAGSAIAETSVPPILITASRVAERVEETLYTTTVVDREAIERLQARDVAEVLSRIPGLQVARNGGPGQATSVFIRGAAGDHTLVLIDGVPVNSGTVGGTAFQHLMPEQIERIEVVRGPASTLYGSSAIGGVVQLFTRRAGHGTSAQLAVGVGSEQTNNLAAALGHGGERWRANASLSHHETEGYPVRPALSPVDRGYRNTSFNGAVGGMFGALDIELSHYQSDGVVEYIDFFGSPVDQEAHNSVSRLQFDFSPGSHWESRLLIGRASDEIHENQSADYAETRRDYIDWQNTFSGTGSHTLTAGATATWTDTELLSFGSGYDENRRTLELYLQDTVEHGAARLQVGGRAIDDEQYGDHFTWKAAAGYALSDATRLHANLGTAFRAPSANDLYGFGGDPHFDPETSISGEIGISHALGRNDSLRLVAFQTDIDDLIETDPITFTVQQIEKARIRGIEVGYAHQGARWSWHLDYVYQDPVNRDLDRQLPRRARNALDAVLRYQAPAWWGEAALHAESERPDSRFSSVELAGFTTVDVTAGYRFSRALSLSARVQNLFDEDYELAATYPAQGRFVGVELRYDLQAD